MEKDRGDITVPQIFRILREINCFFMQAAIESSPIHKLGPQIHD